MAVRTTPVGDTIVSGAGVAQPNVTVRATLLLPAQGIIALDSAGEVIDLTPLSTTANGSGVYLFDAAATPVNGLIAPGDIFQYVANVLVALPGCQWQIDYLSTTLVSPSFAYSAGTLHPSAWSASFSTLGLIKLYLTEILGNATADQAQTWTIALDADATWTGGIGAGQRVTSGQGFPLVTDSSGNIFAWVVRQSELNPSTGHWIATPQGGNGQAISFQSPALYTNDAGSWLVGTTYALNAVVRDPATDIPYISLAGGNVGHALSDATKWAVYPGEKITAHQVPPLNGSGASYTAAILTHSANVPALVDDPVSAPATVDDDLHNLAARVPGARRAISTSAAINAVTDDNLFASAAGGAIAPTLPLANARTRKYYIIKTDNVANVTVTATGGNTINGAATLVLGTQYQWAVLESDGASAWYAQTGTGGGGASTFSFAAFSANHSIVTSDSGLAGDGTSGSVVFSLPTAIGATQVYAVKALNLTHPVSVATGVGGQTIDGASSVSLVTVGQVLVFASDNANWRIESGYSPNPITGLGDLIVGLAGGVATRLGAGADGFVLTADSSQSTGLKWIAGGGGGSGSGTRLAILDGSSSPPVAAWNDAGTDFVYLDPTTP